MKGFFSYHKYFFSFAVAGFFLFGWMQYAHAFMPPIDCEGPYPTGQQYSAHSVGTPHDPDPAPKINQFSCGVGPGLGDTNVPNPPANTRFYRCEETSAGQILYCRHYLNPSTDYYTCTYFGDGAYIGSIPYFRVVFDNCTHSLIPPTLSFSAAPPVTINLGESVTLSWSSANATSCTASGGWSGSKPLSGSEVVTPAASATYTLSCTGAAPPVANRSIPIIVVIPDILQPTIPTGLAATVISYNQINISWNPSTDTGGSGLAGYILERCIGSGCTAFTQIATVTATTYSNTSLTANTSYSYRVRAYDGAGNHSVNSTPVPATTSPAPDTSPPSQPGLTGSAISPTQINLTWTLSTDNVGVAGYRVYRGTTLIYTASNTTTTYSDLGLTESTMYSYHVDAYDAAGNSRSSITINISTPAPADVTPPNFTFTAPALLLSSGTTASTLAGTSSEPATCKYSVTAGTSFAVMTLMNSNVAQTSHSVAISGLSDGTTYTYYVKCSDSSANISSDYSHMFSVDAPAMDMTPPVISNGAPSGQLIAGTTTATMSVMTNKAAYCGYNLGSNAAFTLMSSFNTSDFVNHFISLTGLTDGTSYTYYVKCQDTTTGVENTSAFMIGFSVAVPPNAAPVVIINATPTSGTAALLVAVDGSSSYDPDGSIAQYMWTWGDGSPNTLGMTSTTHTYTTAGSYSLTLTAIDDNGSSGASLVTVTVSAPTTTTTTTGPVSICTASCTTNADCAPGICGPAGFCVSLASGAGPVRYDGYFSRGDGSMSQPTPASFPSGTASVIMSVKTDANAECQYSAYANNPYDSTTMNTFTTTGSTVHSVTLTGLAKVAATTYTYYVRCRNAATDIVNDLDYEMTFGANAPNVVQGPHPYVCFINPSYVRNSIPYYFDICVFSCKSNIDCAAPTPTCDITRHVCAP